MNYFGWPELLFLLVGGVIIILPPLEPWRPASEVHGQIEQFQPLCRISPVQYTLVT